MISNILDVFNQDAFSAISLSQAVNDLSAFPMDLGRIGKLGIFSEQGIETDTIAVEIDSNTLKLVPNTPVGAPASEIAKDKRKVRNFRAPYLPVKGEVLAVEVQNIRGFGTTQLMGFQEAVNRRAKPMINALDATVEFHRMGALKGIILDADGSTIYDLFTEFGVTQNSVDFVLGTATTEMKTKCTAVSRLVEAALGIAPFTGIDVWCGKVGRG